jgi:hypothetical protein
MDDELYVELEDDFNFEQFEDSTPKPSAKIAPALPLSKPSISTPSPPISYRSVVELTPNAGRLFDFTKTKLTPVQQLYIIGFATRGTKKGASEMAGVPFTVINRWMEDPEFVQALQVAVDVARDSLEEELLRRAMDGSDKLLLEALKAAKPERYNRKAEVNVSGNIVHSFADLARQALSTPVVETEGEVVE